MPTRADFLAEARTWQGVPWRHLGKDRNGIDCGQLVLAVGRSLGITTYKVDRYPKRPRSRDAQGEFLKRFVQHFRDAGCVDKTVADLAPADLLILRLDKYPFHCGIYTGGAGNGHFIHSYAEKPWMGVVEMPFSDRFRRAWTHCLSVPGLSD